MFAGTERYTINLANALVEKGVQVTLVSSGGPYEPYISKKIKLYFAPIDARNDQNREVAENIILQVAQICKPQLIHSQCRNSLICSQRARNTLKIPALSVEHLAYKENEFPFVSSELIKYADKVITITPNIAKNLIKYGVDKSKIKIIYNGLNLNEFPNITKSQKVKARKQFNLKETDKVVLCLSRIVPEKGLDKLVEASSIIASRVENFKVLIAGDDEGCGTKQKLQNQIESLKLSHVVSLFPATHNIRLFHSAADIFCHPPISRGMSVMEAMASRLPIVAQKALGEPTVVLNNLNGLLLEKLTREDLADKLIFLLQNPRLAVTMGKSGYQRIKEVFNLEKTLDETLKTYEELVSSVKLA
jgi:glycosyltransferase involved in cell wall biosynthesis